MLSYEVKLGSIEMNIYELKIKIYLLKDIKIDEVQGYIAYFIDSVLIKDNNFLGIHEANAYKYYSFDSLYSLAKEGTYQKDNTYVFRIRTVDYKMAEYLYEKLIRNRTKELQGLTGEIKIIKPKLIKRLYTLTPVVLKTDQGYWKNSLTLADFEERLKVNLIKKYKEITGEWIDEDFQLYHQIRIKNKIPVSRKYKNIKMLGDMIEIEIAENENAQKLARLALGAGLLEMNARGFGFVNYTYY